MNEQVAGERSVYTDSLPHFVLLVTPAGARPGMLESGAGVQHRRGTATAPWIWLPLFRRDCVPND